MLQGREVGCQRPDSRGCDLDSEPRSGQDSLVRRLETVRGAPGARFWNLPRLGAFVWTYVLLAMFNALPAHAQIAAPVVSPTAVITVPILMYHHVGNATLEKPGAVGALYDILTTTFEAQMAYLVERGYTPLSIDEMAWAFNAGWPLPDRPVVITFDDANQNNFDNAFPILQKYHLFATFFIPTRVVGTPSHLTWDEITTMQRAGMRFGAHTLRHAWLTRLRLTDAKREIAESKTELESHLGMPVTVFAYPYGAASPQVIKLVQGAGYIAAVGTSPPRLVHAPSQLFYLTRLGVYRNMTLAAFGAWLEGETRPVVWRVQRPIKNHRRWNLE